MLLGLLSVFSDAKRVESISAELSKYGVDHSSIVVRPGSDATEFPACERTAIVCSEAAFAEPAVIDAIDCVAHLPIIFVLTDQVAIPLGSVGEVFDLRLGGLSPLRVHLRYEALSRLIKGQQRRSDRRFHFHSSAALSERARRDAFRSQAQPLVSITALTVSALALPFTLFVGMRNAPYMSESVGAGQAIAAVLIGSFVLAILAGTILATEGTWAWGTRLQIYRRYSRSRHFAAIVCRLSLLGSLSTLFTLARVPGMLRVWQTENPDLYRSAELLGVQSIFIATWLSDFWLIASTAALAIWFVRLPRLTLNWVRRDRVLATSLSGRK